MLELGKNQSRKPVTCGAGRLIAVVCLFAVLMSGCGGPLARMFGFTPRDQPDPSPEQLAREGLDEFQIGDYNDALKKFEKIKDRYPFSEVSLLAELKAADSHYHLRHFGEARTLYEEFENNHPTNEAIPYVLFQLGMCYFNQFDTVDRDTTAATSAIQAFSRLQLAFPNSPYNEEVNKRIRTAKNFLARHEFYVATFYLRTQNQKQATTRLEHLIAAYPETEIVPEATRLLSMLQNNVKIKRSWRSWLPFFSRPY